MKKLEIKISKATIIELQKGETQKLIKEILELERELELNKANEIKNKAIEQIKKIGEGSIIRTAPKIKDIILGSTEYFYYNQVIVNPIVISKNSLLVLIYPSAKLKFGMELKRAMGDAVTIVSTNYDQNEVWIHCEPGKYLISIEKWNKLVDKGFNFEELIFIADPELKEQAKVQFDEIPIIAEEEWPNKELKEFIKLNQRFVEEQIHNPTVEEKEPGELNHEGETNMFLIHKGYVILSTVFIPKSIHKRDKDLILVVFAPTSKIEETTHLAPVMADLVDTTRIDKNINSWRKAEPGFIILTKEDYERVIEDFQNKYWVMYRYADEKTRTKCIITQ